jgi:hypothetical protein
VSAQQFSFRQSLSEKSTDTFSLTRGKVLVGKAYLMGGEKSIDVSGTKKREAGKK